ncbi:hypothetical protein [Streptomyces neyagawaensis]|uniref:hypothetical protein n=1 Tax=Streptomyces neyagawaensis TaxID=42238 RepID=UPI0012FE8786|nr:hypothetical protein [Streptomyces neyagawaensis]MCL6731955.1 hypothetical protein [Streptomyces neyagawaensis]MDE1682551.1 hypothetical protein [Streptomyces neyagawaensis]
MSPHCLRQPITLDGATATGVPSPHGSMIGRSAGRPSSARAGQLPGREPPVISMKWGE